MSESTTAFLVVVVVNEPRLELHLPPPQLSTGRGELSTSPPYFNYSVGLI